jgi:hypothetical protein
MGLTQLPIPQGVKPAEHSAHVPSKHLRPLRQILPHAPQLAGALFRSTQTLPQAVLGLTQSAHLLLMQKRLPQSFPQAPQWSRLIGSKQVPPQRSPPSSLQWQLVSTASQTGTVL